MDVSPPATAPWTRRSLLRLLGGAGLTAGVGALAGCSRAESPQLLACRGTLPAAWVKALPSPWKLRSFDDPAALLAGRNASAGLLQLSDGWAQRLSPGALAPLAVAPLLDRLEEWARPVSRLFAPTGAPTLAFPWSSSPWVLLLRDRPDLARRAAEGWDLLLDQSLRGRLVLPSSPRVVIALMGENPERLRQLRSAALASDDRDGLALLLAGLADAAVVPRQRVVPLLRRDQRLQAVLPSTGSPLSWSLLLRPAGAPADWPRAWMAQALAPPLLPRLLAAGWVPPLPRAELARALEGFPAPVASLLLPPEPVLARCQDLPPLAVAERSRLQALWNGASPAPVAS